MASRVATRLTQSDLRRAFVLHAALRVAKTQHERLIARWQRKEKVILAALAAGALIEPGTYQAAVRVDRRRIVSWKNIVVEQCGAEEVARIVRSTAPTETPKLGVSSRTTATIKRGKEGGRRAHANVIAIAS